MKLKEISSLLLKASVEGAEVAIAQTRCNNTCLSKAEAYRIYGRSNIDRWISEGLIHPSTVSEQAHKTLLNKSVLESVAAASNRMTYLPVADR